MMRIPNTPILNAILQNLIPRIIFHTTMRDIQRDNQPLPKHLFNNLMLI